MRTQTTRDLAVLAGISRSAAVRFVDKIVETLVLGFPVRLDGLGTFRVSDLCERTIKTPILPGGEAVLAPRRVVRFKRCRALSVRLNEETNVDPKQEDIQADDR